MEDLPAYLLSREFRAYILDHDLFFPLLFLGRVVGIATIELIWLTRVIEYHKVVLKDLTVALLYFL